MPPGHHDAGDLAGTAPRAAQAAARPIARAARFPAWQRALAAAFLSVAIQVIGLTPCALGDNPPTTPAAPPVEPAKPTSPAPAPTAPATQMIVPAQQLQMEVVSFRLQGKQPWQRVRIPDLDAAVTPAKERLLPLLRLLGALKIDYTQLEGVITFQPAGLPEVAVDIRNRQVTMGGAPAPIVLAQAESVITHVPEVYVPPAVLCNMLAMSLQWDEQTYEYVGRTEQLYEVWRAIQRQINVGRLPTQVPEGLPQLFPPNRPDDWGLDFMELRGRAQEQLLQSGSNHPGYEADSLTQSFWGRANGGRYYLEWAEPTLAWNRQDGFTRTPSTPLLLNWGEIVFDMPDSELGFGDSNFALSELAVPFTRVTGVRFNGMAGQPENAVESVTSGRGARRQFLRPQIFEGFARVGSKAELFINDRSIATDEVLTTYPGAPPDEGLWHFKDVTLPPGTTNEIRIVITDPSGFRTQIVRTILSTASLVSKGQLAYTTAIGTNRDSQSWDTRGLLAGWRALYGVSDHLSVGSFMASQNSFINPAQANDPLDPNARPIPRSSMNAGVEAVWQVLENAMFSGTFALSARKDQPGDPSIGDSAFALHGEFAPTSTLNFHEAAFRYGPDYFNGIALRPHDRTGQVVGGRWKGMTDWTVSGSFGGVANNLDHRLAQTTTLDFETFKIQTTLIPRTTTGFEVDRITSGFSGHSQNLLTWELATSFPEGVTLDASIAGGTSLMPNQDPEFFTGLNIPDLPLFATPTTLIQLRKAFESGHNLGAMYKKDSNIQRLSVLHDWRPKNAPRFRIFTELGWDFNVDKVYFDHRDEYFLTPTGSARVGLQLHSERDEQSALIVVTIDEMFSFYEGSAHRISERSISPWNGGVQGQVLANLEGDGRPRDGEKGVPDVKVTNGITNTTTDADGYFILPSDRRLGKDSVFLDSNTIPATQTVINGVQSVYVGPNSLTRAYLAVTPAHYAKGFVYFVGADGKRSALVGAKVSLVRNRDQANVGESYTASDGSYYLGNLAPGVYTLVVERESLPATCDLAEYQQPLKVEPKEDMTEYKLPPFLAHPKPASTGK